MSENKEKIYITGHRNPDLDSLCSAYAYANLKNQIDPDHEYVAVRCGHLSENNKKVFENLGIEPPSYMRDIYPKAKDVVRTSGSKIQADSLLSDIASVYEEDTPSVVPVFDGEKFYGLLSIDDIASWTVKELSEKKGMTAAPRLRDVIRAHEEPILATDLYEEAKQRVSAAKHRGLAVFEDDDYIGYVTRRCFLKSPRHNLILVDHNEPRQSIYGIETANIVEIIDHHRLDAVKTDLPIYIAAEPLGSTCTIVYRQFMLHDITPDVMTLKVLLTGIVADTLILRSPTTTAIDKKIAHDIARICNLDLQEFGLSVFASVEGLKKRDPAEAINSDFKTYKEAGTRVGIGQCEVTTLKDFDEYKETYLAALDQERSKNGLDWAVLMITDVIQERSVLLTTEFKAEKNLSYERLENHIYDMPDVLSRKKQLLPEIVSALNMQV